MNFKNILLFSLIILILSVSVVSAADCNNDSVVKSSGAGDFVIDNNFESITIVDSKTDDLSIGTFDDLQAEINNASDGAVLDLYRDYNSDCGSTIQLNNKNLTIDGHGHTLDCLDKNGCSAFYSHCGNITLKNLNIINGHNADKGGAIHITGSAEYTLENCTFKDNLAYNCGGAIYNDADKPLTITNCVFKSNTADKAYGGAIYSKSEVNIYNSIFNLNNAHLSGGAILCEKMVSVSNSTFQSNRNNAEYERKSYGGAIHCYSTVNIDNSTFKDNSAYDYGGAIYAKSVNININQNNTQSFNSFFIINDASYYNGGAIYAADNVNAVNTLFSKNHANVDGGAVFAYNNVNVSHCLFESNEAADGSYDRYGGAIRADGDAIINNCTFNGNLADNYGGAVYAKNVYINTHQDYNDFSSFFIKNTAGKDKGGAVFAENNVYIVNTNFTGNKALVDGGAVYSKNNVNVKYCWFESNKAEGSKLTCYGGAIRAEEDLTVDNSTFKNNYAENRGGAIYASKVILKSSCYFEGNTARDYGGAIYTDKFDDNVVHASFINNKAESDHGGAIYINSENWITFSQCVFVNNHCKKEGGAFYLDSRNAHLTLKNNVFIGNSADEGQAVYNCGVYDGVTNNFWGGKNPSSDNDVLIEWEPLFVPNVHHVDSDPLKMDLEVCERYYTPKTFIEATVSFLNSKGELFNHELFNSNLLSVEIYPYVDPVSELRNMSSLFVNFLPEKEGLYEISANFYGYEISKTINFVFQKGIVVPPTEYCESSDNASDIYYST